MEARPFIHRKGFYIPTLWLDVLAAHAPDHGENDVTLAEEQIIEEALLGGQRICLFSDLYDRLFPGG